MDQLTGSNIVNDGTHNPAGPSGSGLNRLQELLQKKWVLVFLGAVVISLAAIPLFFSGAPAPETPAEQFPVMPPSPAPVSPTAPASRPTALPTEPPFTPEQLKVIGEQKKTDDVVGAREIEIKTKYPWFMKLPLRGESYFVYFDQNKKAFVGLLYPKAGDNVEAMKTEIIGKLKTVYGIPVEDFSLEWGVIRK